jgi:acylphosphatase
MTVAEPARRYLVAGRVQGVGFRWWTRSLALELGIQGSVRNLSDGSVEVIAHGDPDAMRRFQERLSRGPSGAQVDRVSETEYPRPTRSGFRIVA